MSSNASPNSQNTKKRSAAMAGLIDREESNLSDQFGFFDEEESTLSELIENISEKKGLPIIELFTDESNRNKRKKRRINEKKNSIISLDELTTEDDFKAFRQRIFLIKEIFVSNTVDFTVFFGVYNKFISAYNYNICNKNNNIFETVGLIKMTARHECGFSNRYKTEKWYLVEGGKLEIYQGTKNIKLTADTKMNLLSKQAPKPIIDSLLYTQCCNDSFKEIIGTPNNRLPMMSICGWLSGYDMKANHLVIKLVDKHRRRIYVRDWTATEPPNEKLGCKVLITTFKKISVFDKTELASYGPILYFSDQKHLHPNINQLQEVREDLSSIDYEEEFENAKILHIQQVLKGIIEGGYGQYSFYRLDDVTIKSISSFFKINDKNKQTISAGCNKGMVVDAKTGNERKLDESDTINYCLQITMKHIPSGVQINMIGFRSFAESIVNKKTARQMFIDHSIADIIVAMNGVIAQQRRFNILLSFYSTKHNENYWKIQKIYPFEDDDDSSEYTSQEESEDSDII